MGPLDRYVSMKRNEHGVEMMMQISVEDGSLHSLNFFVALVTEYFD